MNRFVSKGHKVGVESSRQTFNQWSCQNVCAIIMQCISRPQVTDSGPNGKLIKARAVLPAC